MKKLLLLLLVVLTCNSFAQTPDKELNRVLAEYVDYSQNLNIDKLMDYMYPRIFELAPKADIKKALSNAYNNKDLAISIDSVAIQNVEAIHKFSKGSFTRFNYLVRLKMKITNEAMVESTEAIKQNYYKMFGEKNVKYHDSTGEFLITQTKASLAIKDNYSKNKWTYIGIENEAILAKIIPAEIKKIYQF